MSGKHGSFVSSAVSADSSTSRLASNEGDMSLSSESRLLLANVSLVIQGDDLAVIDSYSTKKDRTARNCCPGAGSGVNDATRRIAVYDVLWAEIINEMIAITFVKHINKTKCRAEHLSYNMAPGERQSAELWISKLLDQAYGDAIRQKRLKVIVNPFGGSGTATKMFAKDVEPLLMAARCWVNMEQTTHQGHAIEIAEHLDIDNCDAVLCVSGDGVPHEVFNGLGIRPDAQEALRKVAVCQLPGGSGNAMCWNLTGTDSPSLATLAFIKGIQAPLDLISITQNNTRTLSFLSQSVGIVAEVDLATENMRWMGGARFTVGFLQRILTEVTYPADIAIKVLMEDKPSIRKHYHREVNKQKKHRDESTMGPLPALRYGTEQDSLPEDWQLLSYPKLGNFYAGNMTWMAKGNAFFPAALPNDSYFDLVTIDADIGRMESLKMMMSVETGEHFGFDHVHYRKVLGYRIIPKEQKDGYISIDGERIPFAPFQAEVHPGLGTVLMKKRANVYEAPGV